MEEPPRCCRARCRTEQVSTVYLPPCTIRTAKGMPWRVAPKPLHHVDDAHELAAPPLRSRPAVRVSTQCNRKFPWLGEHLVGNDGAETCLVKILNTQHLPWRKQLLPQVPLDCANWPYPEACTGSATTARHVTDPTIGLYTYAFRQNHMAGPTVAATWKGKWG